MRVQILADGILAKTFRTFGTDDAMRTCEDFFQSYEGVEDIQKIEIIILQE